MDIKDRDIKVITSTKFLDIKLDPAMISQGPLTN